MQDIQSTISAALTGGPSKTGTRWQCSGVNVRGEAFDFLYRHRDCAEDYRDEIRSLGGTATVRKVQA